MSHLFNFGGGYFGTTAFLLDGSWDTSLGWGSMEYVPSVESVQEFKVQQNSFTAQYGWEYWQRHQRSHKIRRQPVTWRCL